MKKTKSPFERKENLQQEKHDEVGRRYNDLLFSGQSQQPQTNQVKKKRGFGR